MASLLQARKHELVRDAIWDAAMDLFDAHGYDETTVDEIAAAAGVSRRTFFRYFSSKSDLMAEGVVSYANSLTDTIASYPASDSLSQVFRETVLRVARHAASQPRTRQVMRISAKYAAAREAQLSRLAELQDRVAEAFALRCPASSTTDPTPAVLAGLTLSVLGATFRSWFEQDRPDIERVVEDVFAALGRLICT